LHWLGAKMTQRSRVLNKIIWSVDAFEEDSPIRNHTIEAIRALANRTHAEVELVYILSPAELNLSLEFTSPWIVQYQPAAESAMEKLVKQLNIPEIKGHRVLVQNTGSLTHAVGLLSSYAIENHVDAIVVSTHARKGVARLLLGSFAETLTLHARLPVLAIGPGAAPRGLWDSVLFPTDLGSHSRAMFEYITRLATQLGAKVTIFHALPNPVEPFIQSGVFLLGGGWVPIHGYFAQDREAREKKLEAWRRWATKRGVVTDIELDDSGTNIPESILKCAELRGVYLIAMAAQSGTFSAALLGSMARQVVRNAPCPVWILRPVTVEHRVQPKAA
jgi:nucleotide-binding universal stress UspA family protein